MRQDGRMNSQLECACDGVNEKPLARVSPRAHWSRSEEEGQARRSGSSSRVGSTSPTTASSSSTSNDRSRESALAKHRVSASGSQPTVFAPPSTPSPHYGFRRNTANIMAAGRRVSHRSTSVPSVAAGDRGTTQATPSGRVEAVLPSSHNTRHIGGATANGSAGREDNCSGYDDGLNRSSHIVRRRANEVVSGAGMNSTAPGTLPGSHGHFNQYTGASGAVSGRSAAGDRYAMLRGYNGDHFFQMDDVEGAPALMDEKDCPVKEFDRQTRYRYPVLWRAASSPSAPSIANESSSSRHQHQQLSPRLHLHSSPPVSSSAEEIARTASPELGTHRDGKDNGEEAKGPRHYSRHAGVSTSLAVESPPQDSAASSPATLSARFAGFTAAQQQRFESLQERGPPGHEIARWKMLELMRHWMSMPSTRAGLDAVIRDVLVDAGIAKAKEAWGGSDACTAASRDSASSLQLQQRGGTIQPVATCANPPSTKAPPKKVSPKNKLITTSVALESDGEPPSSTAHGEEDKRKLECSKEGPRPLADEAPAPSVDQATPASTPTPHAVAIAFSSPALAVRGTTLPPDEATPSANGARDVKGDTDEFAALPVASLTPEKHVAPLTPRSGVSLGTAASRERTDAASDARASPHRYTESPSLHHSSSEEALPDSSHNSPSPRQRSRSNNLRAAPSRREATYEEIPRFYFPLGRPTTREMMISGPLSSKHENPHLKIADGVSMSAPMYDGGESSRVGANAGALVGTSKDSVLFPESRRAQKVAPMSQLHALDDRQVAHYIQREFGRLPPLPRHSQRVWLLGGRLRSGSHNHTNLPFAKQELLYRQQFIQCVQRLCSQCFGVPRYFAFVILRLIQWEMHNGNADAAEHRSPPQTRHGNGRLGSSSSLMSHTANGGGSGATGLPSVFLITAQHMKNFYEAYLKNKDMVRRIFDLLILSSRLPTSPAAAASLAAMSAATETNDQAAATPGPSFSASPLRSFLLPKDFVAYINVLLTYHPGLAFLRQTPDFQTKYLDTVIYRIFYELDRFDRGCISYSELAASRLIDAFRQVDSAEDINMVLLFFSYEHFYVLYCRFWELDEDRDMLLAPEDLMRYAPEDVMNPCIVQRVFAGVGRRRRCNVPHRIGYEDFVWFCLSEEDKSTPQAIRYWFRVLDLDGDGVLSVYELRQFYNATCDKIAQYVQEGLVTFEDVVCQVFDMMRCSEYRGLFLSDLMREPEAAAVALNLLTNVVKFLQFEQRDPFVAHEERLLGGPEQSTWDRFARLEYDRMALEADGED
ncbi:EF-hand domain pair family protein [Leishmania donovani]|uniref:EF-hand domain pair family protein n=1 Tax=Leishmania donovani TaxID=5661 RepID=A0A504XWR7_LEIDO|nr:EF-hand domain pair family protein [Leishmania donovani]TPP55100.1 EF-hand domain pair family protein [Leishmania donovani]